MMVFDRLQLKHLLLPEQQHGMVFHVLGGNDGHRMYYTRIKNNHGTVIKDLVRFSAQIELHRTIEGLAKAYSARQRFSLTRAAGV